MESADRVHNVLGHSFVPVLLVDRRGARSLAFWWNERGGGKVRGILAHPPLAVGTAPF